MFFCWSSVTESRSFASALVSKGLPLSGSVRSSVRGADYASLTNSIVGFGSGYNSEQRAGQRLLQTGVASSSVTTSDSRP